MYKNIGKKIKGIVEIVTKISITVAIIVGVFFLLGGLGSGEFAIAVLGIVMAPLLCFVSWLSGLVIYAIGDIADNLNAIRVKIAGEEAEKTVEMAGQVMTVEELLAEGAWKCASCGMENPVKCQVCFKCGTTKAWSEGKSNK